MKFGNLFYTPTILDVYTLFVNQFVFLHCFFTSITQSFTFIIIENDMNIKLTTVVYIIYLTDKLLVGIIINSIILFCSLHIDFYKKKLLIYEVYIQTYSNSVLTNLNQNMFSKQK